jgi:hypothetical protein
MTGQNGVPAAGEGRAAAIGYLAAVLLLPLLVLWRRDNALFTGYGYIDPWIYFGYFRNLVEFKRTLFVGDPHSTHLSWILPGAALHSLFTPVTASYLLHLSVHTLATTALFLTLKWLVGTRRAFVTAMVFSANPWLWSATGWDYVDGIGVAYCLLTMALLTWAALIPGRRWALMAAGMSLAALLDTGAGWLTLAPVLPLYYAGLMWTLHGRDLLSSFIALCGWFVGGCLIMAAAFRVTNYCLDGHHVGIILFQQPRFWVAILAVAMAGAVLFFVKRQLSRATPGRIWITLLLLICVLGWIALLLITWGNYAPASWRYGLWANDGLSPWLLFPMVAGAMALVVLYSEKRKWRGGISVPVLFSLQLLCALAWMTYAQLRGRPELGGFYSASKLMPFSFLVIGARFWPDVEKVRLPDYLTFCSVAAVTLGYAWLDEGMTLAAGLPYAAWVGAVALLVPLFWIRFPEYLICSLGGFFILTAVGAGARYGGINAHAFRDQLQSLSVARERVEIVRHGRAVRFWYDDKDAAMPDALALNATYLGERSLLSHTFSAAPCDKDLAPSTIVAAIAANPLHGPDFQASALATCWSGKRLRATPIEIDNFQRGTSGYEMSLLDIEAAPSATR